MADLESIQKRIIPFRNERDWAQFHDPKNLAEALSIEAGELLENFLWKTTEQSRNLSSEELQNVKEELADIFDLTPVIVPVGESYFWLKLPLGPVVGNPEHCVVGCDYTLAATFQSRPLLPLMS